MNFESQSEPAAKQQIFEKLRKRMAEAALATAFETDRCPELNPDVIVISADQTLLFEPRNPKAIAWLEHRCGPSLEIDERYRAVRVHPCQKTKMVRELETAGFAVV